MVADNVRLTSIYLKLWKLIDIHFQGHHWLELTEESKEILKNEIRETLKGDLSWAPERKILCEDIKRTLKLVESEVGKDWLLGAQKIRMEMQDKALRAADGIQTLLRSHFRGEKGMRIVPTILTDDPQNLKRMLAQAETFTDFVQIDFMDGNFVPSKSIVPKDLAGITINIGWEAHLMVKNPIRYLSSLNRERLKKVIFHWEADPNPGSIVSAIRDQGLAVGLGINPNTELSQFENLVHKIDSVLFLSVHPGFYGSTFVEEVLEKIKEFRSHFPSAVIGINGGIALDNIQRLKSLEIDYACVGSRIFRDDPHKNYEEFVKAVGWSRLSVEGHVNR